MNVERLLLLYLGPESTEETCLSGPAWRPCQGACLQHRSIRYPFP